MKSGRALFHMNERDQVDREKFFFILLTNQVRFLLQGAVPSLTFDKVPPNARMTKRIGTVVLNKKSSASVKKTNLPIGSGEPGAFHWVNEALTQ